MVNLVFFAGIVVRWPGTGFGPLLLAAGIFGLAELGADFLCVHFTVTLDYGISGSVMILASPWWMPPAWMVVAIQVGTCGAEAIRRLGRLRGALVTGLPAAVLIPFYEEMAWGAHWWRYQNCLMIGHTPVYIILAEALIGMALAWMADRVLRHRSFPVAAMSGVMAAMATIMAGTIGWGIIEFLGRGIQPAGFRL